MTGVIASRSIKIVETNNMATRTWREYKEEPKDNSTSNGKRKDLQGQTLDKDSSSINRTRINRSKWRDRRDKRYARTSFTEGAS